MEKALCHVHCWRNYALYQVLDWCGRRILWINTTPVSALIHAATMVTAGVFMIARCSPLFEYPPTALIVITSAGATTSFLAATTGILQNDLKRVIAYSTCSQLGYMIFAEFFLIYVKRRRGYAFSRSQICKRKIMFSLSRLRNIEFT